MSELQVICAVLIMAAVTALLRLLPALLFGGHREPPEFVLYLGRVLPYAVMGMLVVYCLRNLSFSSPGGFLPELLAGGTVVGTYLLKRSTLLSIIAGTVCYMLLVQLVF